MWLCATSQIVATIGIVVGLFAIIVPLFGSMGACGPFVDHVCSDACTGCTETQRSVPWPSLRCAPQTAKPPLLGYLRIVCLPVLVCWFTFVSLIFGVRDWELWGCACSLQRPRHHRCVHWCLRLGRCGAWHRSRKLGLLRVLPVLQSQVGWSGPACCRWPASGQSSLISENQEGQQAW